MAIPALGPVGAPVVATPTIPGQIAQAAGQYPQEHREAQLQQAQVDEAQVQAATQRLSVLNQLIVNSPGTASDPNIVGAYQRAFKSMGMSAPLINDGGRQKVDAAAVGALAPAHDFIAKNWDILRTMAPEDRDRLMQAAGLGNAPQALLQIPRSYLQSPGEATALLSYVRTAVQGIGKPGGSIDNAIAAIDAASGPLSEIGLKPDVLIENLKPDVYAQLLQKAQLDLLQARTADERAKANERVKTLPDRIRLVKNEADLKAVMEDYYPAMAGAAQTKAGAAAEDADTHAARMASQNAKDWADADAAHNRANLDHAKYTQQIQSGNVDHTMVSTLQRNAHETQERVDKLRSTYEQQTLDQQTYAGTPYGVQAGKDAAETKKRIDKAQQDANDAKTLYSHAQSAMTRGGGNQRAAGAPKDMRAGTVEHYQALDAGQKSQYLQNPNVPQDVRDYLRTL